MIPSRSIDHWGNVVASRTLIVSDPFASRDDNSRKHMNSLSLLCYLGRLYEILRRRVVTRDSSHMPMNGVQRRNPVAYPANDFAAVGPCLNIMYVLRTHVE